MPAENNNHKLNDIEAIATLITDDPDIIVEGWLLDLAKPYAKKYGVSAILLASLLAGQGCSPDDSAKALDRKAKQTAHQMAQQGPTGRILEKPSEEQTAQTGEKAEESRKLYTSPEGVRVNVAGNRGVVIFPKAKYDKTKHPMKYARISKIASAMLGKVASGDWRPVLQEINPETGDIIKPGGVQEKGDFYFYQFYRK